MCQEPLSRFLAFFTRGRLLHGSFLHRCQIRLEQHLLFRRMGRVESKDLITGCFLGQGCSGIFYETTWLLERTVRLARKDFPGVKGDIFQSEAVRLFKLKDHPNIVKTLCWTVDSRSCSLVMEYMRDDLSSFMRKKKEVLRGKDDQAAPLFPLLEALEILLQIATGVEFLHDEGIFHGDLKPNNVLIDREEGQLLVKLADFGLIETKRTTLVSPRALCFQMIEWSAPELFEDYFGSMSEDLDFLWATSDSSTSGSENGQKISLTKADSYSFGLTSAYILGGQLWNTNLSPTELRKCISSSGLRPELPPQCPEALVSLISSCWNADPKCRPAFSDIRSRLEEIIQEQLVQGADELGKFILLKAFYVTVV